MQRRTKIVATIGPASADDATLRALVGAGMDVARLSLSHGPLGDTLERIERLRRIGASADRHIGVLADLPGPKIRAAAFAEGGVRLEEGSEVDLVPGLDADTSDERRIVVDHASLLAELAGGDLVALGDGAIQLVITDVGRDAARAHVLMGGWVQGRPGVALPPGRFSLSAPTTEDVALLEALAPVVDFVAISFVRRAADMERARAVIGPDGPMLIAKIETREAAADVDSIIAVSDGVMVARGDLGIRCAIEDVPHHQKRIIRTTVGYGRPVITATQMLESMIRAPVPTRAEVSDIANAVFDGTSALMLSAETAIGHDPVNAVRTMARVAARAEQEFDNIAWGRGLGRQQVTENIGPDPITAAVSAATWRASLDADVTAIIACTNSGATARAVSRFRPRVPIVAATPSLRTARQLALAWGITPIVTDRHGTTDDIVWFAVKAAAEQGIVAAGDLVAVAVGSPSDPEPATDTLRLVRVR